LATFIVVNKEGWIVTAAHVLNDMIACQQHTKELKDYEDQRAAIASDSSLSSSQRKKMNSKLIFNKDWITTQSLWWCQDGVIAEAIHADPVSDVAVIKLANFNTASIPVFPKFNPPELDPPPAGSLCRLGFPFTEVTAAFDETTKSFTLVNFTLPPMFPNDGIHTRIQLIADPANNRTVKFIETSTPGLRGQSGGPLFDVSGNIWGVQSRTGFLELGFSPKKKDGNKEIVEHQFLNVGLASHVQHVVALFKTHGVPYESA